jgi:phosphatidylglycerophosphate synthase
VEPARRPLKSRSTAWARRAAGFLALSGATANQISIAGIGFTVAGALALLTADPPWSLIACSACIQLRLLCNLLDGMVALEWGKQSPLGALYNEIPDRVADSALIVVVGYAVSSPWLGWCSALLAMMTAYIRALGGALGLPQDFRGPMAKPHRMAVLTAGCLLGAVEASVWHTRVALLVAEWLVGIGSLITCGTRTAAIARGLLARRA